MTAFLEDAARVDGAADEASFELGMIDVREIFAAADPVSARERIRIARDGSERAISERGPDPTPTCSRCLSASSPTSRKGIRPA